MSNQVIIIHYNEIALKGGNRSFFEKKLANDIYYKIEREIPGIIKNISRPWGYILVTLRAITPETHSKLSSILSNIFGIANFSFSQILSRDIEILQKKALKLLEKKTFSTFKIHTRRTDKNFPLTSPKINEKIGGYIIDHLQKKVNLTTPDATCFVQINADHAFLYTEKHPGLGGLPQGTGGKAVALLSGGIDSPVAAWSIMKKGVHLDLVHFHSVPYTSPASIDKVKRLAQTLTRYQKNITLHSIQLSDVQREITMRCPEKLRIILFRRFMLRIAEKISEEVHAEALITGDSLGQVASQTIENMRAISDATRLPILRPLISFDKEEIMDRAKHIGTYTISIEPHEDCCTVFIPKKPETKARLEDTRRAEKLLDIEVLVNKALRSRETETLTFC